MRQNKVCPKCSSKDMLRLPRMSEADALTLGTWWPKTVWMTRYVCGACGYTEQWIDSAEDIDKIREKFAGDQRAEDSARPPGGPA